MNNITVSVLSLTSVNFSMKNFIFFEYSWSIDSIAIFVNLSSLIIDGRTLLIPVSIFFLCEATDIQIRKCLTYKDKFGNRNL